MHALLMSLLILTQLVGVWFADGQSVVPQAILVHRFEKDTDQQSISDVVYSSLTNYVEDTDNTFALRVCSKDKFPLAIYAAAANPIFVQGSIQGGWRDVIPQKRIIFLRSEDCSSDNQSDAPVEVWVVPKGASLPPHVESARFCQLQFGYVAANYLKERALLLNRRDYQSDLRKLVIKLRASPKAIALFWGQYLREPSPALQRNLDDVATFMKRHGFGHDRYLTSLERFGGDYRETTPEPQYPDILTVELSERCRGADK